jgi:hypothetical protein
MTRRALHRTGAAILGAFLVLHLGNHLLLADGFAAHIAAMERLRGIYRLPPVEAVLLAAVALQMVTGGMALWRLRHARLRGIARWQALSGAYLLAFLAIHVAAILWGRATGLDTNIHFAAAGYAQPLTAAFFYPYYFLAVLAVFVHLGAFAHGRLRAADPDRARSVFNRTAALGTVMAGLFTAGLAGWIETPQIPEVYLAAWR